MLHDLNIKLPAVRTFSCARVIEAINKVYMDCRFSQDFRYINGFNNPVIVAFRSGQSILLDACYDVNRYTDDFVIQVETKIRSDVNYDVDRLFDVDEDTNSLTLVSRTLKQAFREQSVRQAKPSMVQTFRDGSTLRTITMEYIVKKEDLLKDGGSIYFHELDLTISLHDSKVARPPHPESAAGKRIRTALNDPVIGQRKGFVYRIEIVDNDSLFGFRFININNQVYKIDPATDPARESGVYLYETPPTEMGSAARIVRRQRYDFNSADEALCLHRTADDALALGNLGALRERQIEEERRNFKMHEMQRSHELLEAKRSLEEFAAKNQIAREKAEAQKLQFESDRREQERLLEEIKLRMKEDRERFEHERDMFRLREKERLEEQSNARKDFSEILKWVPLAILGIGVIVAAVAGGAKPK